LLSALVFRTAIIPLDKISCEGITGIQATDLRYAQELGFGIKLLAVAARTQDETLDLYVAPHFVPQNHPLNRIEGADNAVLIEGEPLGQVMFVGPGAGSGPTASAVVSDILNIVARQGHVLDAHLSGEAQCVSTLLAPELRRGRFYVRLGVLDQPGVIGMVGQAFGAAGVSLESVVQKASHGTEAELVIITHWVSSGQLQAALDQLQQLGVTLGSVLRVLDQENA